MKNGEKLRRLRENMGISQYRLAKLSGADQSGISKYERGDRNVGLEVLQKICPVLGVSVSEFLDETDTAPKEKTPASNENGNVYSIHAIEELRTNPKKSIVYSPVRGIGYPTEDEFELVNSYRLLDDRAKENMWTLIDMELKRGCESSKRKA